MRKTLLFILMTVCYISMFCQVSIDNFENGLEQWTYMYTIYPDYTGWEPHSGDGIKELDSVVVYEGDYSLRCADYNQLNGAIMCVNTQYSIDYGIYTAWLYMAPNTVINMSTDAHFYFQFKDINNFYLVTVYPADSDNPGIRLRKTVGGVSSLIEQSAPLTYFNHWYQLRINRTFEGYIIVSIYNPETDTETIAINTYDNDITKQGHIAVGSYSHTVYWDDIGFSGIVNETNNYNNNPTPIYPIPCKDYLCISETILPIAYEITGSSGQVLCKGNVTDNKINVSKLLPGVYFIRITEKDNSVSMYKFVKTNY